MLGIKTVLFVRRHDLLLGIHLQFLVCLDLQFSPLYGSWSFLSTWHHLITCLNLTHLIIWPWRKISFICCTGAAVPLWLLELMHSCTAAQQQSAWVGAKQWRWDEPIWYASHELSQLSKTPCSPTKYVHSKDVSMTTYSAVKLDSVWQTVIFMAICKQWKTVVYINRVASLQVGVEIFQNYSWSRIYKDQFPWRKNGCFQRWTLYPAEILPPPKPCHPQTQPPPIPGIFQSRAGKWQFYLLKMSIKSPAGKQQPLNVQVFRAHGENGDHSRSVFLHLKREEIDSFQFSPIIGFMLSSIYC